MRLIDLDKVRWTEGFYDMHTGEQYAPMMFNTEEWIEWATENAKVKAIPIEWIKEQLQKEKYRTFLVDYIQWGDCLRWLIDEWEKENETN